MIGDKTYIIPSDADMKNTNTFLDIEEIKQTLKSANLKNAILN